MIAGVVVMAKAKSENGGKKMSEDKLYIEKTIEALKNSALRFWKEDLSIGIASAMNASFKRGYVAGRKEASEDMNRSSKKGCPDKNSEASSYEKGLEDAMKALRLLCLNPCDGGMYMDEIHTLFGSDIEFKELMNLPAKEVVCKVLGYLGKKKVEEERLKSGFEIGDEVRLSYEDADSYAGKGVVVSNGEGSICVLWEDGTVGDGFKQRDLEKTGKRHDALRLILGSLGEK